jgi:hypothetical protein
LNAVEAARLRRLRWALYLSAAVIGAIRAWSARQVMDPAGISHLDLAEAMLRGEWGAVVNGYWGPLYSGILALALQAFQPSASGEASFVHAINWMIYLLALAAFGFFWRGVIASRSESDEGRLFVSEAAWWVLGFALFTSSSLDFITVDRVTADLTLAAMVFLASAALIRLRRPSAGPMAFVLLGVALGLGYLAKSALFPLAFVFLAASYLVSRRIGGTLLAAAAFLLVAAPWIAALSLNKGRLTFGDTGALVYSWFVNGVTRYAHWQGEPPGRGEPVHPSRKLHQDPAVYEFGARVSATHAAWYDPSYWYEGLEPHLDARRQARALLTSAHDYFQMLLSSQAEVAGLLALFLVGGARPLRMASLRAPRALLVTSVAPFAMYGLVHVEPRFIGAFVVTLCAALLGIVRFSKDNAGAAEKIFWAVAAVVALRVAGLTVVEVKNREPTWTHPQWQVAQGLLELGVRPGDRVGSVGYGFASYWARLARVRIVAEIPDGEVDAFWSSDDSKQEAILRVFHEAGVRVLVAERMPSRPLGGGWRPIGTTGLYLHFLDDLGPAR